MFGVNLPKEHLYACKDLKIIAEQESVETKVAPYISRIRRIQNDISNLPSVVIEQIEYTVPLQSEIRLTGKVARNNMIEIKDPHLNRHSGPESEGTLFDHRMGTISGDQECGTCKSRECKIGHQGYILFPDEGIIPYVSYVNTIIDILSCFCLVCKKPLLDKLFFESLVERKVLKDGMTLKDRLTVIKEYSLKQGKCINVSVDTGRKCNQSFKFDRKKSKDKGLITYEMDKNPNNMTGYEVDQFFRTVFADIDVLKYFGYTDVEEICAYICVGVIVPPTKDRPFIEGFDKINNPINEKLSRIVTANQNLKHAIAIRYEQKKYAEGMGSETRILSAQELDKRASMVAIRSQDDSIVFERTLYELQEQLSRAQIYLADRTHEKEVLLKNTMEERVKYDSILKNSVDIDERTNAVYEIGRLDTEILSINDTILNDPTNIQLRSVIAMQEHNIAMLNEQKKEKSRLYAEEIEKIKRSQQSSAIILSAGKSEKNLTSLIVALYEAHKEYVELVHSKVSMGKNGQFRREGLGKNAHFVARSVARPGVDIEIDEIEIPEILAGHLTVTVEVTDRNIIELQQMLRPDSRKITHIFPSGDDRRIDVTDANVQDNKIVLRRGDVVTRHLKDGDIVVAIRMPSLHTGNMKAFRARIIRGSLAIGVHMIWTTSYNLDFDGDEMSLYVVQGEEATDEVMRTMYAPLGIIASRSSTPIGGVVYNSISAWYLATGSSEIISRETWDTAYLKLTGREQLESLYERLFAKGVTTRTGRALFSMLLPEDFNYPGSGQNPIDGVIIESGVMIAGTLTSKHIGSGKADSIIQALHHRYGVWTTKNFLNDVYSIAYLLQMEFPQTVTPEDCAFGEHVIAKIGDLEKFERMREEIEKVVKAENPGYYTREFYKTEQLRDVDYYIKIINEKFPKFNVQDYMKVINEKFPKDNKGKASEVLDYPNPEDLIDAIKERFPDLSIEEVIKMINLKFPRLKAKEYAENYIIQRRIEKSGIFSKEPGGYDYAVYKYEHYTKNRDAARILVNSCIADRVFHTKTQTYMRGYNPRLLLRRTIEYNEKKIRQILIDEKNIYGSRYPRQIKPNKGRIPVEDIYVKFPVSAIYSIPTANELYRTVNSVYMYKKEKLLDYYTRKISSDHNAINEFNRVFGLNVDLSEILIVKKTHDSVEEIVTQRGLRRLLSDALPDVEISETDAQAIVNDLAYKALTKMGIDYDAVVDKIIYEVGELPVAPGGEDAARIAYSRIIQEVKKVDEVTAQEMARTIRIGKASEIEGKEKLRLAEKQIRALGPVPRDKLLLRQYKMKLMEIISSMNNVGTDAAKETRRFIENNLMDMSAFGAGAKGSEANIAMMGGHVGQQQIKGQFRLMPAITNNTRCTTNFRPGDSSIQSHGYVSNSYWRGLLPIETFQTSIGSREGISDIATKTSASGLFNKLTCKAMENLVTRNGSVINQAGDIYQFLYGEDGFQADKLVRVGGRPTFIDLAAIADRINYKHGWMLSTQSINREVNFENTVDTVTMCIKHKK